MLEFVVAMMMGILIIRVLMTFPGLHPVRKK